MKERVNISEGLGYVLTRENKELVLQQIAKEREKKGMAESLIPQIDSVRRQAESMGDYTTSVIMYQEKLLCAQHIIMENRKNPVKVAKGLLIMVTTSDQMVRTQRDHAGDIDPVVSARCHRFLGRQSDMLHLYQQSEGYYRQGLEYFETLENVEQRYHGLELSGFLAYSLLKQRKDGWFDLTQETLNRYNNSPEGVWLRENDYYTWAVWMSGVELRISKELLSSESLKNQYRVNIDEWLGDADKILQMPDGDRDVFGIRRQELDEINLRSK